MFKCAKCGLCCRNLDKSPVYAELHNGDGVCKYLEGDSCSIYLTRPIICRVDESYEVFFKNSMSRDKYEELNYEVCNLLKKSEEN
ncbi:YkgJ family cysteine cluster protein [Bacillus pacificus]|nr:YkgJ family cysteine cluster protein [Bacillus pacificus]